MTETEILKAFYEDIQEQQTTHYKEGTVAYTLSQYLTEKELQNAFMEADDYHNETDYLQNHKSTGNVIPDMVSGHTTFSWSRSELGHAYWKKIYNRIQEEIG
jgi:hypothetical protein